MRAHIKTCRESKKEKDEKLARRRGPYSEKLESLRQPRYMYMRTDALNAALLDPDTPAERKEKLQRLKNHREWQARYAEKKNKMHPEA